MPPSCVVAPHASGLCTYALVSLFLLQRNSISPAEREKYRPRSPVEPEHKKMKKEEKDGHVSAIFKFVIVKIDPQNSCKVMF